MTAAHRSPVKGRHREPLQKRITHGRHCTCTACRATDWTNPDLAGCGMHGDSCPRVYAPLTADDNQRIDWLFRQTRAEMARALTKFDTFNSPHEGYAVCREELEKELFEHVCANTGRTPEAMGEAIQLAAMALRYVYDLADWGPIGEI